MQTERIAMLEAMLAGTFTDPGDGRRYPAVPFRDIRLVDSTDGGEADLVAPLGLGRRLAVVADTNTHDVMGARVAKALASVCTVDTVVIEPGEATSEAALDLQHRTRHADGLVAVGSGTLQDLVKYATHLSGRPFATFATAASMNGYTSTTASITVGGFKQSLPAHTPRGIFMDVEVAAEAPAFLARSGLGDCLCRSTAQVDWRMASALVGTPYMEVPFRIQVEDEAALLARAGGLDKGDRAAIRALYRVLTWTGLGTCFTGTSHHGSMSEHLVSHWLDMFAGDDHPGTLHGHQVGVAAVAMSRLQHRILTAPEPPRLRPVTVDAAELTQRYGSALGAPIEKELAGKPLDAATVARLQATMADWDAFRAPLLEVLLPTEVLVAALRSCGGYVEAAETGLPARVWRDAIVHAREIRNRFSILDVAAAADVLVPFAADEAGQDSPRSS